MIIATAGHIDHGKTALVRALTGVDTDRLPEEKARGISIDIGVAHCTLGEVTLGFVDVPGHERFVRNMLSGVYAVGHVLLVVAADDGVMPQTREHLHIVDLLGVAEGTVVITKRDRVDAARVAQVEQEARELVRGTLLQDAPVLPVSALGGEGVEALRERLAAAAAVRREGSTGTGALARYVVDRVFTSAGSGTIVTGTVISGSVAVGDTLVICPDGKEARVRKLQRHGQATERACAGERCAINLANVEQAEVRRGHWLVAPQADHRTDLIDVRLSMLPTEGQALKHWTPVHVHIGATDVTARLALRRGASIAPGAAGYAQLRLARPVHAVHGDRLIVRDQSATRTLGGGMVLNPFSATVRRADREAVLAALDGPDVRAKLEALVKQGREGLPLEWLARSFNLPLLQLVELLPPFAVVVRTGSHTVFSDRHVEQLQQTVVERIGRFHAQYRELGGIELAQLHHELARGMPLEVFAALLKQFAARAGLQLQGSRVRFASHDSTDNPRDLLVWQRMRPVLIEAGGAIRSVRELSDLLRVPLPQMRDLVHRKAGNGELVKLTQERFAMPETMRMLADKARQAAAGQADGLFTAAQFRDVISTGRTLAIEILECLDRQGVTQRRGDARAIRGASATASGGNPPAGREASGGGVGKTPPSACSNRTIIC